MPTSVDIKNLKINKLTEAQYDTAVQGGVIGENELSVLTDVELEQIQVSSLPTASADELGKIYQYIGATDSTYTNAYFYKCVSDGLNPATYSWEQVDVMPAGSSLPSQTGNAGKFLTTNGTNASWGTTITGQEFNISRTYTNLVLNRNDLGSSCILLLAERSDNKTIAFYHYASSGVLQISINGSRNYNFDLNSFYANSNTADLGTSSYKWITGYITKLNNGADIAVPTTGGTIALQIATLPTAAASLEGQIYQYTGATDLTYTNGRFYKCVSDGVVTPTYSWEEVQVQASSGGLPSQTGQSGKFLTTDGTDASWATLNALQNTATGTNSLSILGTASTYNGSTNIGANTTVGTDCVAVGCSSEATGINGSVAIGKSSISGGNRSVAIGVDARADGEGTIAIGRGRVQSANTIQLDATNGVGLSILDEQYTMHVVLRQGTRIKLIDSDGTIPADRLGDTTGLTAGNYRPRLTIDAQGNKTITWVAE